MEDWKENVQERGQFERHARFEKTVPMGENTHHKIRFLDEGKLLKTPSGDSVLFLVNELQINGKETESEAETVRELWISVRNPLLVELKKKAPLKSREIEVEFYGKGRNQRARII